MARGFTRRFSWDTIAGRLYRAGAIDGSNASAGGVNPEVREPTGDRERRRRENRRFVLTFGLSAPLNGLCPSGHLRQGARARRDLLILAVTQFLPSQT